MKTYGYEIRDSAGEVIKTEGSFGDQRGAREFGLSSANFDWEAVTIAFFTEDESGRRFEPTERVERDPSANILAERLIQRIQRSGGFGFRETERRERTMNFRADAIRGRVGKMTNSTIDGRMHEFKLLAEAHEAAVFAAWVQYGFAEIARIALGSNYDGGLTHEQYARLVSAVRSSIEPTTSMGEIMRGKIVGAITSVYNEH